MNRTTTSFAVCSGLRSAFQAATIVENAPRRAKQAIAADASGDDAPH